VKYAEQVAFWVFDPAQRQQLSAIDAKRAVELFASVRPATRKEPTPGAGWASGWTEAWDAGKADAPAVSVQAPTGGIADEQWASSWSMPWKDASPQLRLAGEGELPARVEDSVTPHGGEPNRGSNGPSSNAAPPTSANLLTDEELAMLLSDQPARKPRA
jgi:hypothetical protein